MVVAVGGYLLDLGTKTLVVARLDPEQPVRLLAGLVTLRLIRNPGAAFSLGEQFTIVFAVLSVAVLAFIVLRLVRAVGHRGWAVALGFLSAGVAGNLTDRLFRAPGPLHGHVVDFIQLPYWPIFNVADTCITTAAVMILVLTIVLGVGLRGECYVREGQRRTGGQPAKPR